jgi:hypothetical protein
MAGRDQAVPAGPFRWLEKPDVRIKAWSSSPERDFLDAACRYAGFTHRRPDSLRKIRCHPLRARYRRSPHLGAALASGPRRRRGASLLHGASEKIAAWRSRALCTKEPATALRVSSEAAVIDLSPAPRSGAVQ